MSAQVIYQHGDPSLYCMACDHYHEPADGCAMFDDPDRGFVIEEGDWLDTPLPDGSVW